MRDRLSRSPDVVDYDFFPVMPGLFPYGFGQTIAADLYCVVSGAPGANTMSRANLSVPARAWLAALGLPDPDSERDIAALPWHHALAIGYAPAWLTENADGIRQDWPRVPLPDNADLLRASAALGARVAALLDPDTPVPGVTAGTLHPALATIAAPTKRGGGAMTEADRMVTAGWGHAGKGGAVMPGRGRIVTRDYAPDRSARPGRSGLARRPHQRCVPQ